jgi:hypothetical protein
MTIATALLIGKIVMAAISFVVAVLPLIGAL